MSGTYHVHEQTRNTDKTNRQELTTNPESEQKQSFNEDMQPPRSNGPFQSTSKSSGPDQGIRQVKSERRKKSTPNCLTGGREHVHRAGTSEDETRSGTVHSVLRQRHVMTYRDEISANGTDSVNDGSFDRNQGNTHSKDYATDQDHEPDECETGIRKDGDYKGDDVKHDLVTGCYASVSDESHEDSPHVLSSVNESAEEGIRPAYVPGKDEQASSQCSSNEPQTKDSHTGSCSTSSNAPHQTNDLSIPLFDTIPEAKSEFLKLSNNFFQQMVKIKQILLVFRILAKRASMKTLDMALIKVYQAWSYVMVDEGRTARRILAGVLIIARCEPESEAYIRLAVYKVQSLLALLEGNTAGLQQLVKNTVDLLQSPLLPGMAGQAGWVFLHWGLARSGQHKKDWLGRARAMFRQDADHMAEAEFGDRVATAALRSSTPRDISQYLTPSVTQCPQTATTLTLFYADMAQHPVVAHVLDLPQALLVLASK